jgi:23S rRNA pseudouridine955/2504/2580 synthase
MAVAMKTVAEDEAGMRLDRWFKVHFPDLSFGHLQKLVRTGQVRVDGGRVKTSSRVEPGQSVRIPPLGDEPQDAPAGKPGPGSKSSEADKALARLPQGPKALARPMHRPSRGCPPAPPSARRTRTAPS